MHPEKGAATYQKDYQIVDEGNNKKLKKFSSREGLLPLPPT